MLAFFLAGFPAAGCAKADPVWQRLASGASLDEQRSAGFEEHGRLVRISREGAEIWLTTELAREDWSAESDGVWRALPSLLAIGKTAGGTRHRLRSGEHAFQSCIDADALRANPGSFLAGRNLLQLRLPEGSEPPERATYDVLATHERRDAAGHRVHGRRFSGEGFAVWPGERIEVMLDHPPRSTLRFATCVERAVPPSAKHAIGFRVTLDGAQLFEFEERDLDVCTWHAVPLPAEGRRDSRLAFEVVGSFAFTSFLAPVVGPSGTGRFGARPWGETRPDIVVFLADTFRADNLESYGARAGLTPNLDRFARMSLRFARAWSVSTHTLTVHSSLFTGLFPPQVGRRTNDFALPEECETVAEILSAAGYRTGAITDSAMVSQHHGMDQGFQWFDETNRTPTLDRVQAFLDADDGRPTFLFIQTYATHVPYRVDPEVAREVSSLLDLGGDGEALLNQLQNAGADTKSLDPTDAAVREALSKLRDLYLGSVASFDRDFERLRQDLQARGLFESGTFVFTSDHGEAFGEHGEILHGGRVFEEQLRVPLILSGRGIEPGLVEAPVSLIDFAPTLAELAGFPARAPWMGRSFLAAAEDRPIFAFQAIHASDSSLAVIRGTRKVVALEDPASPARRTLLGAFDLERDPAEGCNLAVDSWAAALLADHDAALRSALVPLFTPASAGLGAEEFAELKAMGYGGE